MLSRRLSRYVCCVLHCWLLFAVAPLLATDHELAVTDEVASDENVIQLLAATEVVGNDEKRPAPPEESKGTLSLAERIARLERAVESDQQRVQSIRAKLQAPDGEYARAEKAFRQVDTQRGQKQQELNDAASSGSPELSARLKDELAAIESKWQLVKERFELAINDRRASQESLATLEKKLQSERDALARLRGESEPVPGDTPTAPPTEPRMAAADSPAPAEVVAAPPPRVPLPHPALASLSTLEASQASRANVAPAVSERLTAELSAARATAQSSSDAASAAEAAAQAIYERIRILQQDIHQQREMRETARRKVDNADQTLKRLNEDLFRKLMDGEDIAEIRTQIRETTNRLLESRDYSRQIATHLDNLQSTLALLQAEHLAATSEAASKRQAAQLAEAEVAKLENPFTPRNMLQWLLNHGPRIVVIFISLSTFLWLTRVFESRLVGLIASRGRRGSREERENRAKTLLGVFNNAANLLIVGGGAVMLLDEVGIPITPVLGGAAVVGLAVAFGAQSLIKDYFTGFMVLFEQQYLVNDVIKIGDIAGQVERISLRMTVLRDIEGRVHFIPHGQINTVTNLTHGWSRAVFEIGIAYKERVDDVIAVLMRLAGEIRQDENFRFLILDDPVMLGVDSFANSAVIIKFYIQTRPLQQWKVKRELLRRIKNEFDRLSIEIPYPHVTVYHGAARGGETGVHMDNWEQRDVA